MTSGMVRASCHCGAVEIRAPLIDPEAPPARCTCSFCRRRQAGNVSVPWASLDIVKGTDVLRCYQFGTRTAEHYFCGLCGIYTHHRRWSNPDEAGVNFGCIDGARPWEAEPMRWNDGVKDPSDADEAGS